ncbi:hypothetical protein D3C83_63230 [compost metagenome]
MPSTPLICSSIGVATVSAISVGLPPGNWALTTMEGGETSGYSPMGKLNIAIRPDRKISVDTTPAKIGRSMKNRENVILLSTSDWGGDGVGGGESGKRRGG